MKNLKVIAFTHKHVDLKDLGNLVICNEELEGRLMSLKNALDIPEIFYIATCNRVEFIFCGAHELTDSFIADFMQRMNFCVPADQLHCYLGQVNRYTDMNALTHLFRMSCSLESLVVGEKEILAQVRRAYERCRQAGFTGDFLRLTMDQLVKTAKEVYTYTNISKNPISVVSLAYRKLKEAKIPSNPRILVIGSGETNQNLTKYLKKHKYTDFVVFNRTSANAKKLAEELNAPYYSLAELGNYKRGFDVMITCTGSPEAIIDNNLYKLLLNGETDKKIIVDLAIPNDISDEVIATFPIHYIEVSSLQKIAEKNMQERRNELESADVIIQKNIAEFLPILKQRRVEVAMRQVPETIKEIKSFALNEVFAKDVDNLDPAAREVLEKVINYMEKKYIKVPMVMAKEILVKNSPNELN
ncbi:glutamyl-tRNA reductase [Sphingobacterium sp. UT-1RO-CII-1]|uniref:glutamyl-tRNA reductase n=1 Tax=Sphingobacterium sp. UT-1RO-CII-1 TaxID=2995225 RepID=UPI00227A5A1B|nr:glutamyl-tRNA reductase [Sphingobacterium sp. UT-1RO-CII-1]MCY4781151.1 glutamyl-tRNA reductase [Sphingobacterium sp. UT-1RO-CII-1]